MEVCGNCVVDDNGDIIRSECAAAIPAAFPWWLIILLVVVVCTLIAVALFVGLRNRKKNNLVSLISNIYFISLSIVNTVFVSKHCITCCYLRMRNGMI